MSIFGRALAVFRLGLYRRSSAAVLVAACASLALGLMTTLAVAVYGGYRNATESFRPAAESRQVQHQGMSFDSTVRRGALYETFNISAHGYALYAKAPEYGEVLPGWLPDSYFRDDRSSLDYLLAIGQGWPFRALRYAKVRDFSPDWLTFTDTAWPRLRITLPNGELMRIGLVPIWRGLIANTVIFGVVWFAVLFLPGLLRRARRLRHGKCVCCGYDLRASPAGGLCPECGFSAFVVVGERDELEDDRT